MSSPSENLYSCHLCVCVRLCISVWTELINWAFIWQVVDVRHWLSQSQRSLNLEDLTHLPAPSLELMLAAQTYPGLDRLPEKSLNGSHIFQLQVVAINIILSLLKEDSPSPEKTVRSRCICTWAAWRQKTLLFITVHDDHSDTRHYSAVQKQDAGCWCIYGDLFPN